MFFCSVYGTYICLENNTNPMTILKSLFDFSILRRFVEQLLKVGDSVLNNNEDKEIDELLKDPKDKETFRNAVEELQKGKQSSIDVKLSGQNVTISI